LARLVLALIVIFVVIFGPPTFDGARASAAALPQIVVDRGPNARPAKTALVAVVGDSLTYGMAPRYDGLVPDLSLALDAKSGRNTAQALDPLSAAALRLNAPVVGITATRDGRGYWLVATDGGVFPFGSAPGYGSTAGLSPPPKVIGLAAAPGRPGYLVIAEDGRPYPFGP